jgi:6-phosphogluconolactonase (cycloisomerase 2 family)
MSTILDLNFKSAKKITSLKRKATFDTGAGPFSVVSHENGASSYLFTADSGSNIISFYKFDPSTVSGTVTTASRTATFATGNSPRSVVFYENGSSSYLFTADASSSIVSFYKFDPSTVSGTITTASRTATFATGTSPREVFFHYNGTSSYLFTSDFTSNLISFYKFNPATVSGTITTASRTATFATGTGPRSLTFYENGANSFLFSGDFTSSIVSFYKFNPSTVSGTITTASRTATFATGTNPSSVNFHYNGTSSYLFTSDFTSNIISFYKFDPATISGTITTASRTATFDVKTRQYDLKFHYNGANSYIFNTEYNIKSIGFFKFNPDTISGAIPNSDRLATFETGAQPISIYFSNNGQNSGVFSADYTSNYVSFYLPLVNYVTPSTLAFGLPIPEISKTLSTPLTLNNVLDDATFVTVLNAGSQKSDSMHPTEIFDYDFVVSGNGGTLNEDFVFSGASAGVSGEYRITMGPSTTVTLANKPVYNDSFTIPSTGTLKLTSDTELGEEFILSAGTTVEANDGVGPYNLTIPYADPGLILGIGITVNRIGGKTQVRALWT